MTPPQARADDAAGAPAGGGTMMAAAVAALRAWVEAAARAEEAARAALAASTPLLGALAALAAQMRAARRLPWDATPLGAFPELRARLWQKQRGAAEALLEQLGGRREELRAVRDAVGAAGTAVLRLYEERGPTELGLPGVLRRAPRCPSLADVLEGLQDVERYYRHLYPAGGVRAALGACFLLVVLTDHEGIWRANCSCSASAWTAWQTWKPSRSPGRGFWSATKKMTWFKTPS
ncbi:AFG2-interacting ribosome maturation factor isoform X2 [Poecile atricapillus]|uniref:AFG2-interacting ribosome maturation factor isoform X2 n=1 Tax=Poecile atricapillus TaxID=48891 RepID=UPI00273A4657|nr:AFG2-interacting ribosome maturation factor isoform X2 [Poecile atricapillus]